MHSLAFALLQQTGVTAKQPGYFAAAIIVSLIAGGVGWLVAAVMGFARARAFGASARWFSFAAVCLLIYHIQFLLLGFLAIAGKQQGDLDGVLAFGAFFNVFVVIGGFCGIVGFVRLSGPRCL